MNEGTEVRAQIVAGPTREESPTPLYQVTLPNGAVLTNPFEFGTDRWLDYSEVVVSEGGWVLTPGAVRPL